MSTTFADPKTLTAEQLENGSTFAPRFDAHGLLTAVAVDAASREVLMVAHMNAEALALTLETGEAHYYSRSRTKIWRKGESSGEVQRLVEMRTDCDQDAIWLRVNVAGQDATCHTGRRSCFYRIVGFQNDLVTLRTDGSEPLFDVRKAYDDPG